jgi:alpha-amylase/alpha-mannosidase (GH57 family)
MTTPRFITIHGHFYQPPRENPWLETVETQDSAYPYHDWNERISAECYAPNAASRILDANDRIVKIVNNYASISFNFGATLLSWLEAKAPVTYAAILEADRISRERHSGHGAAISQAYNHIIMPLANERDRRTQVRWGIRDFEMRFGRKPEGMWLPETAVDVESLEALAAEGIEFTILEPHQIKRWRGTGETAWQEGSAIDPTLAYRCNLPSGRAIDILVYDGPISRGVAFENLLTRGETFAHRLVGAFSDHRTHEQLVNIATDGETYGHHHRHGEMALAYALEYIEERGLARITNYGEYLELHPPQHEVEIAERTAWSCSHGVERWRSDCGCNTGAGIGWNQQWRTPLRESLDWLRDEVCTLFEQEAASLLVEPWSARDAYIDVVLDRSPESVDRFLAAHALAAQTSARSATDAKVTPGDRRNAPRHADSIAAADQTRILELMELQRNAMLMFTSCGWFFNDISGIETVQVLHYAGRVIQLAAKLSGRDLEPEFLQRVSAAKSNLPQQGDARRIYERDVVPTRLDLRRVAAHYAVASLFDAFSNEAKVYSYRVTRNDFDTYRAGRTKMIIGSVTITSQITRESEPFEFFVIHLGETDVTGGIRSGEPATYDALKRQLSDELRRSDVASVIRDLDQRFGVAGLTIQSLFRDEQRRIISMLCDATLAEAESAFRQLHERYDPLMRFHARLGIPVPNVLQTAAEFDLNLQLRRVVGEHDLRTEQVASLLREAREQRVAIHEPTLLALKRAIESLFAAFRAHPDDADLLERCFDVIEIVSGSDLEIDLRRAQNDYYAMMHSVRNVKAADAERGSAFSSRWLQRFDALGDMLAISPAARGSL